MLGLSSTLVLIHIYRNFSTPNSTPIGVPQWGDLRFNLTHNNCCPKENDSTKTSDNVRYYRLPFTGKFSEQLQHRLNNLIKKYCKSVAVKIVFTSFKIGQAFSTKDSVPSSLKSNVVYQFKCAGCSACYIALNYLHEAVVLTTQSGGPIMSRSHYHTSRSSSRCNNISSIDIDIVFSNNIWILYNLRQSNNIWILYNLRQSI